MTVADDAPYVRLRRCLEAHDLDGAFEVAHALKFLEDNLKQYHLSKNFYVSGSSAGSYIIMMLCVVNI